MSTTMSNLLLDKEILLESGTNELELLVFDVADYTFGINVAKVREVLPTAEITRLPKAHSSVRGVFKLRNQVIPCVSLLDHLGIVPTRESSESTIILTDFNQQQTAFLVDAVERIHRLSWQNILSVPGLEALSHTPVTALARCDDRLIVMLDFEMILDDVTDQYFRTDTVANPMGLPREKLRILLAEDSPTVREAVGNTLLASGYTQVTLFENGAEAWTWIEQRLADGDGDIADLVISDVEMPQVDGFHLTKRIKDHPVLRKVPVLLYSSIITPDNYKKGQAVGADAQVSKPELKQIVALADELIATAQKGRRAKGLRKVADMIGAATDSNAPAIKPAQESAAPSEAAAARNQPKQESVPPAPTARCTVPPTATSCPDLPRAEAPPPPGVPQSLWATFRDELTDHVAELRRQLARVSAGGVTGEVHREVARTLHTIKSASMVVPLDPVTRCTHLVEGLLEPAKQDRSKWPQAALVCYTDWLWMLVDPESAASEGLASATHLEAELGGASSRCPC